MADETKEADVEKTDDEAPKKSKKGLFLGGGIAGLIGLAYLTFLMAVPGVEKTKSLDGPFVAELTPEEVSVNLSGNDGRHYLAIMVRAEFASYDESYVLTRTAEPLYAAMLQDRALTLLSGKTKDEVSGVVGKEALREELRDSIDPILFPVHFGKTAHSVETDPESGLRPGRSSANATWRGLYYDHVLKVDAPDRTIALDDGEKVPFEAGDQDVRLVDPSGDTLYVDVSGLVDDFVGEINVGVHGRIRSMYFSKFILQ